MPAFSPTSHKLVCATSANPADDLALDARDYEQRILADMGLYDVTISNTAPAAGNRSKLWYHKDVRQFKRYDPVAGNWFALTPNQLALHILHRTILGAQVDTSLETGDRFLFWDVSLSETKAITRENLRSDIGADEASDGEIRVGTVSKYISARRAYTANAPVTVAYASTLTFNMNNGINFVCELSGNPTLANPTNAKAGASGQIILKHSNRQIAAKGSAWKFPGGLPALSTGSNVIDVISYFVEASNSIICTMSKGFE